MKLAFAVILMVASASAQESASLSRAQPACGPVNVQFQIKTDTDRASAPQVESGKSLVYVIEDQRFKGVNDVTVRIGLDGDWVGATRGDSYLFFSVEPGEHHLCVEMSPGVVSSGRLVSLFGLTTEAGKVYYFRARTSGGPASALDRNGLADTTSIDLDLVNKDEGKFLVTFSSPSVSHAKINKDGKK